MQYTHIRKTFYVLLRQQSLNILRSGMFLISVFLILYFFKTHSLALSNLTKGFVFTTSKQWLQLSCTLMLLPLNYLLEALKWQILVRRNEVLSLPSALTGVLAGTTFALITPNGVGDFAGRLLHLRNKKRSENIGLVLYSNLSQMLITLAAGTWALFSMKIYNLDTLNHFLDWFSFVALATAILMILFLVSPKFWIIKITRVKFLTIVYPFVRSMEAIQVKEGWTIIAISCLRYLVFTSQFILLLNLFGLNFSFFYLFEGVCFIFLVKTLLPSIMDFGVREAAAVFFFTDSGMIAEVMAASITLWFINILMPAIAGLVSFPFLRFEVNK